MKKNITTLGSKFLPEEIANIDGGVEVYSLEDEFAKTRKNKNWAVLVMVLIFIVVMVSVTVLFTYYTYEQDKKIDISFNEFDDLRLKEVLSSARMNDNNLMIRRNELYKEIIEMRTEILRINNKYLAKENSVLDSSVSDSDKKTKLAGLRVAENLEIANIRKAYAKKIGGMRANIRAIEKDKREAEKKLKEESERVGKVGDEDRVHAVKMKTLSKAQKGGLASMKDYYERYIDYLEQKYNPSFRSGDLKSTLRRSRNSGSGSINLREYDPLFSDENIISRKRFESLRGNLSDRDKILRRLMGVDYKNSVPHALKGMDNLSKNIVNEYENLWFALASTVKMKKSQIEDYRKALDAVLKERPESGYIISAANPSGISLHINRLIRVKEGTQALVFRNDDEFIGRIQLYRAFDGFRAKVVKLEPGKKMKPFDRILIKIK